jgi:hypothetical protein
MRTAKRWRRSSDQAWPVISHRMMMIGIGTPIRYRRHDRMGASSLASAV